VDLAFACVRRPRCRLLALHRSPKRKDAGPIGEEKQTRARSPNGVMERGGPGPLASVLQTNFDLLELLHLTQSGRSDYGPANSFKALITSGMKSGPPGSKNRR